MMFVPATCRQPDSLYICLFSNQIIKVLTSIESDKNVFLDVDDNWVPNSTKLGLPSKHTVHARYRRNY